MKKCISSVLLLILVFSFQVSSKTQIDDDCTSLSDWTVSDYSEKGATVSEIDGEGIKISLSSSRGTSGSIEKNISFDGNMLTVSAVFSVNNENMNANANNMFMTLSDGTEEANVLYYKGGILYAFTNEESYKIADSLISDVKYEVIFAVDVKSQNNKGIIWFKEADGEYKKAYSGDMYSHFLLSDFENLKLIFKNSTVGFATTTSDFIINSVSVYDAAEKNDIKYSPNSESGLLTPQNLSKITYDFGGRVHPDMYDKENYILYKNGEKISYLFDCSVSAVELKPIEGFYEGASYKLSAISKKDIFDNELEIDDVEFMMSPEGYKVPIIEINASDLKLYSGKTVDITVLIESEAEISKVVYKVKKGGNSEEYEITDSSEGYKLTLLKEAGVYEISAYAVDVLGGKSMEKSVFVEFIDNTAPTVSIDNITNGASINEEDFPNKILLSANDKEKLEKVELYINNELKKTFFEAPYEYELTDIPTGRLIIKAICYDDCELTDTDEKTVLVMPEEGEPTVIFSQSFDSYAGGKPTDSNFSWWQFDDAAMLSADTSREDIHGKAMKISYSNNTGGSQQSFFNFANAEKAYNKLLVEYDVNIKSLGDITHYIKIGPTSPHSRGYTLAAFSDTLLTYYEKGAATSDTYAYPKNEWLSVSFEINYLDKTCKMKIKDKNNDVLSQTTKQINEVLECAEFCLYFPTSANQSFEASFDNFRVSGIDSVPVISEIGQNGDFTQNVSPDAKNISVKLTAALKADSVTKESVALYIGDEEILIKEVSYASMVITVVPDEKLRSDEEYTVIIKETTRTPTGAIIGEKVKGTFYTTVGEYDLLSSSLVKNGNTSYVSGEFVYNKDENRSVYIILTVWENNKMTDITVMEKVLSKTNKTFTTNNVELKEGQKAELYVWDSLSVPDVMTTKIYRY